MLRAVNWIRWIQLLVCFKSRSPVDWNRLVLIDDCRWRILTVDEQAAIEGSNGPSITSSGVVITINAQWEPLTLKFFFKTRKLRISKQHINSIAWSTDKFSFRSSGPYESRCQIAMYFYLKTKNRLKLNLWWINPALENFPNQSNWVALRRYDFNHRDCNNSDVIGSLSIKRLTMLMKNSPVHQETHPCLIQIRI